MNELVKIYLCRFLIIILFVPVCILGIYAVLGEVLVDLYDKLEETAEW